ncbi:MAG: 2'-deoxycytidine 5'-triphosphate deaminase, partial [Hyphomicrobium sp.]|uniref:2'-deoxycytidine 5'-triphosphate deaminase domain-containing protein n=1 Tax=Hyphomicrobium sp. TaxID=82 RepID=UPI003D0C8433
MALFPAEQAAVEANARGARSTGILPYQALLELVREREIDALAPIEPEQVQPASLDLRLGATAYRIPASFLPGADGTVMDKIQQFGMYPLDLGQGAVLERGCVYIVPLLEHVALGHRVTAFANPKSSTGRLDI